MGGRGRGVGGKRVQRRGRGRGSGVKGREGGVEERGRGRRREGREGGRSSMLRIAWRPNLTSNSDLHT